MKLFCAGFDERVDFEASPPNIFIDKMTVMLYTYIIKKRKGSGALATKKSNARPSKKLVLRATEIVTRLKEIYPDAVCALEFDGEPWKLMVMGRLSAQCTDKRVNEVCKDLFREFPTADALAYGDIEKIREIVRPCGLFRVKSDDIKEECRMLVENFGGELPDTMDELLLFRGVGRKIANLLLGDIFGKGGIVADTHCIRICGRLGFYPEDVKDPLKTERIHHGCRRPPPYPGDT